MICAMLLALAIVARSCAAAAETVAEVRMHSRVPTIFINGKPHSGASYMTYNPQLKNFKDFAELGCTLYTFSATSDYSFYGLATPCWTASDTYDYSQFDERAAMILEACPGAYIFPRVYVSAPPWWCAAHPDELAMTADGILLAEGGEHRTRDSRVASFASEVWRRDAADNLRRFIAHVESSQYADRVIGYHIASGITEEWMYWGFQSHILADYSPANVAGWRRWLTAKYGTDPELQRAWRDPNATLSTALVPDKKARLASDVGGFLDPTRSQPVIDYNLYHSWITADTIKYFARVVKEETNRTKLFGAFYGYCLEICWEGFGMPTSSHLALKDILTCPDIDFLSSPTSYTARIPGVGYSTFMSLTESVKLHGKIWFDENDLRTPLVPVPAGLESQMPRSGWTRTVEEGVELQWREIGNVLAHGAAMWWFDMSGGWYDHPKLLSEIGRMREVMTASLDCDRSSIAEIAFVVDETSPSYWAYDDHYHANALSSQRHELGRIGAPVDFILLSDLSNPKLKDYRMYLFPNAFVVDDKTRQAIRAKLAKNHATAIWVYAPGVVAETVDPAYARELTGFTLRLDPSVEPAPLRVDLDPALAQRLGVTEYGAGSKVAPRIWVDDPEADRLGKLKGTNLTGLATKKTGGFRSIYSSAALLPAALLRHFARDSGVHVYTDSGDAFYANRHYVCINARGDGERTIVLPKRSRVLDVRSGTVLAEATDRIVLPLKDKQTALLAID